MAAPVVRRLHASRGMTYPLACLLAASALVGCATDPKGEEDELPIEGKDDSFFQPTSHGDLAFGTPARAQITAGEGFHSWTFTLTGSAKVKVATSELTGTLDTVLYIYKRTSPSSAWGEYAYKNDDASDHTSASTLTMNLTKGQYRVLVKGFKRAQRGNFRVGGTCSGAGCPTQAACEAPRALPSDTGYGGTCGATLARIFANGSVDATQTATVAIADRCAVPPLQRAAVDYYVSYFGGVDAAELEVETKLLGGTGTEGGTVVGVTDGGDESAMSFVFDTGGKLVASYQHNQSPDVQFFCRSGSAAATEVPGLEDCMGSLVGEVMHASDDESDVDLLAAPNNLPVGLDASVRKAMVRYAEARGLPTSTRLSAAGATWDTFDGKAARLTVSASGRPATWLLADSQRVIIEAPSDRAAQLVCR